MVSTDRAVNPSVMEPVSALRKNTYTQCFIARKVEETKQLNLLLKCAGSCFVVQLFNRQIANGGPVTITHPESVRYFMNTKEACQLILKQLPWAMEGGLHIRYG
jgi:FlaA1/EpsC-like NDP-sugar epimerase